jgi:hypothetical protein
VPLQKYARKYSLTKLQNLLWLANVRNVEWYMLCSMGLVLEQVRQGYKIINHVNMDVNIEERLEWFGFGYLLLRHAWHGMT